MKFDIQKMNEYMDKVSKLTGTKIRMKNPVTRVLYEGKSVDAGRWLTLEEFENSINTK